MGEKKHFKTLAHFLSDISKRLKQTVSRGGGGSWSRLDTRRLVVAEKRDRQEAGETATGESLDMTRMKALQLERRKSGTLSTLSVSARVSSAAIVLLSSPQSWMLSHQPSFLSSQMSSSTLVRPGPTSPTQV